MRGEGSAGSVQRTEPSFRLHSWDEPQLPLAEMLGEREHGL